MVCTLGFIGSKLLSEMLSQPSMVPVGLCDKGMVVNYEEFLLVLWITVDQ